MVSTVARILSRALRGLVGASLVLVATTCRQPSVLPLSGILRTHLQAERFDTVSSVGGLPAGVQDELRRLFGSPVLDIAEPGAAFPRTAVADADRRPRRQLIAAGCSTDHCLVYYARGNGGRAWRVALFRWSPDETRFEWGGAAPGGLVSIADVRQAVLARRIASAGKSW